MKTPANNEKPSGLGTTLLGVLWTYSTWQLIKLNRQGESWAGAAALATALLGIATWGRLFGLMQEFATERRRFLEFQKAGEDLAKAGFASLKDLEAAGLLNDEGLFLGVQDGHDLRYNGQNSALIQGPPEAEKTNSVFVASMFPVAGKTGRPTHCGIGHNVLLNDPNCEAYSILKGPLERAGIHTFTVTPFYKELSEITGLTITDAKVNLWPELRLDDDPRTIRSIVVDKAELIVQFEPQMDAKDRFFKNGGRTFAEWLQEYIIAGGKIPTLPMMHALVSEGPAGIIERCQESAEYTHVLGGGMARRAKSILGYATRAPEQFAGYLGACEEGLRLYDAGGVLGDHFTPEGVDPWILKDDRPTVGFICYPTQKSSSHQPALNLTFTHFTERLARDPRVTRRVSFLIDEAAGLGFIPNLPKSMNEYRKFGLRWVLAFQELGGQVERIYGASTVKEILAACEVVWSSNVREPASLEMLSAKCGEAVVADRTMNETGSYGSGTQQGRSYSRGHKTRPLLRPDDVRRLPTDQALVIVGNKHPILLQKMPYWKRPAWNQIAGKNPYRQS